MLTALIVAVLAYALDQLTKYAVESTMQLGDSVAVIPGVLRWHYILNPGAAFSIGEDHTWVFTIIQAVVAVAALAPASLAAQSAPPPVWLEYTVDDELERYVRSLQALGAVPLDAWTIRPLSPPQMDRLRPASAAHPWAARLAD
ncbi:signal peptidase II, partial [Ensifer sp. NM-2]|uniref:signal peptidase II n=1 Tax=Ensifer sp. NM-2 TaxID=2109730 RepID=UPI0018EB7BE7